MLRHLSIRDFVIVAALDLEFDSGFSVFSGETGAGKTMVLTALGLVLGEKSDSDSLVPIEALRFPSGSLRLSVSFHSALLSISGYFRAKSGFSRSAYTA